MKEVQMLWSSDKKKKEKKEKKNKRETNKDLSPSALPNQALPLIHPFPASRE